MLRASSGGSAGVEGGVNDGQGSDQEKMASVFTKMALNFASESSNAGQLEKLERLKVLEGKMRALMEVSAEEDFSRMASQQAPSSAEQKKKQQRMQEELKELEAELMQEMGIESMGEIMAGSNPSQLAPASSVPPTTAPLATRSAPMGKASPQERRLRFAVEDREVGL